MSSSKKYLKMFPWTDYHAGNIDWLLELTGAFDDRLTKVEEKNTEQDQRLDGHDEDIAALNLGLTNEINARIAADDALSERITSEVSARIAGDTRLQENIDNEATARANAISAEATARETADTAIQTSVANLTTNVTNIGADLEAETNARTAADQAIRNDLTAIDGRVTTLEGHSVVANPGGSGIQLNTLAVDNVIYSVPQGGGGGGGGSTVTINPAGPATGEAEKIDVDGTIWSFPQGVDTSDLISDAYDSTATYNTGDFAIYNNTLYKCTADNVTGAWDSTKWTATNCTAEIEALKNYVDAELAPINKNVVLGRSQAGSMTANGSVQEISGTSFAFPSAGTYLVTASIELDTTNYGSAARYLGFYLRDDDTNWGIDKFTVQGNEPALITQAADLHISKVLKITSASVGETFKLCSRVVSGTNKVYDYSTVLSVVKLSDATT